MSSLALMEVQRALITKLQADGVLAGMLSGIYDIAPQHSVTPYAVIGAAQSRQETADAVTLSACRFRIEVWTQTGGRKSVLAIMNRMHALLHLGTLSLSGMQLVMLRVEAASSSLAEQASYVLGELDVIATVAE